MQSTGYAQPAHVAHHPRRPTACLTAHPAAPRLPRCCSSGCPRSA